MQFKSVGSLFGRYQKLLVPPQASVEKKTAEIITRLTPLHISAAQVTYTVHNQTLSIQVPSVVKSELQRYKPQILAELQTELGIKNSPKIIF